MTHVVFRGSVSYQDKLGKPKAGSVGCMRRLVRMADLV